MLTRKMRPTAAFALAGLVLLCLGQLDVFKAVIIRGDRHKQ
jgi:hypothetical protein